jgi:3-methylcrotonyl-CoA carboxylase alpha subunit
MDTLLIANRGEIARRIIRTCRRLGIRGAAVYSDADASALHVAEADVAVRIGGPTPRESYLDIHAVIAAARSVGADAVHPGYGFLAESPAFAEACVQAGIVFVGPPAEVLRALGDKDRAKAIAESVGVPVVPGSPPGVHDHEDLIVHAARIGFPVLVKPVAGGGGRGMRVVEEPADLSRALEAAAREVASAFGDERLMVERRLQTPRHVEVQVLADGSRAVHLLERDCSIQRRWQKVIEEAPAPRLGDLRGRLHEDAVRLAEAAGLVGAATIEFLVTPEGHFFAEVNPRLQVEHPVTEMITGIDIVEWQLRIAAGEPLTLRQDDIRRHGHAIEARLYAEDPDKGFAPSIGPLRRLRLPEPDAALRVETGVAEGDSVTPWYDAMIAKLVAWGPDRAAATRRLRRALGETAAAPLATNAAWLEAALGAEDFAAGTFDTGFADRIAPSAGAGDRMLALAVLAVLHERAVPGSPWLDGSGWQLNDEPAQDVRLRVGDEVVVVAVHGAPPHCRLGLPRGEVAARLASWKDDRLAAVLDGLRVTALVMADGDVLHIAQGGSRCRVERLEPAARADVPEAVGRLAATMPGLVTAVLVAAGDSVARGAALVVVEAMKVEHTITAPRDGIVARLPVAPGQRIAEGQELVVLDEPGR